MKLKCERDHDQSLYAQTELNQRGKVNALFINCS